MEAQVWFFQKSLIKYWRLEKNRYNISHLFVDRIHILASISISNSAFKNLFWNCKHIRIIQFNIYEKKWMLWTKITIHQFQIQKQKKKSRKHKICGQKAQKNANFQIAYKRQYWLAYTENYSEITKAPFMKIWHIFIA